MKQKEMKETEAGITAKKKENFSEWYTQVIQKAEMADYTDVSGCIVFRPRAYAIWEKVQAWFDKEIKKLGIVNAYFPLFIPKRLLEKEAEHVEGFTPEVAWVTQAGETKLNEWLAIRPTSETIMYESYKKWIRSYRDLPLRLNQWCNVVRWEFKNPVPFIRTREFLWQEGHTAFADKKEAEKEVMDILKLYKKVYEELYAVPVLIGKKSQKEKFAGAEYTTSIETFVPNGKAVQAATSHFLGQNFSKAFDISFLDEKEQKKYAYQNSWGMTTRTIGIMIMIHGDNKGLIIPPRVAPVHAIIVPILFEKNKEKTINAAKKLHKQLQKENFATEIDLREGYTSGWKFNEWEMKGIPIRIEIGPKDLQNKQAVLVRRDTGEKQAVKLEQIEKKIPKLLEEIQQNLFDKAQKFLKENTKQANNWLEFDKAVKEKKLIYAPWCNATKCEEEIKDKTGVKVLNIPFKFIKPKGKCVNCNNQAKVMTYFARSY